MPRLRQCCSACAGHTVMDSRSAKLLLISRQGPTVAEGEAWANSNAITLLAWVAGSL